MTTELITWHPMSEPPDTARAVLAFGKDTPIGTVYFAWSEWHDASSHYIIVDPKLTHWADLKGPQT